MNNRHTIFTYEEDGLSQTISNYFASGHTSKERYPGVTRVLSKTKDQSGLDRWRARVGEEEADRILTESQAIGTSLDNIIEKSFLSDFVEENYRSDLGFNLYLQIKPFLKKIKPIGLQLNLWSDKLRIMGFCDCLGYYDGKLSLIDFKNSRSNKSEEYISDYYLQCTIYCMMFLEMTGIPITQIVLIIAVRDSTFPQVITQKVGNFLEASIKRIKEYHLGIESGTIAPSSRTN